MKQEIAKEGILPYSLVFAQSYDFSFSRLFRSRSTRDHFNSNYSEKTPVATLALHWTLTTIMVLAGVLAIRPIPYSPTAAFSLLTSVFVYDIDVICFTTLSFGILYLRFSPSARWAEKTQFKHPVISVIAASILFIGCLFPLIFIWFPDPAFKSLTRTANLVPWYAGQTAGLCVIAFAFLYWLCFRAYISVRSARQGETLHVMREPKFKQDSGGLTQILEIVTLQWKREIGIHIEEIEESDKAFMSSTAVPAPGSTTRLRDYARGRDRSSTGHEQAPINENEQNQYSIRRKPVVHELAVSESGCSRV